MQNLANRGKQLVVTIFVVIFVVLSVRLLFNTVPVMLRQPNDYEVAMGVAAIIAWVICTVFLGLLIKDWRDTKKLKEKERS